MAGPPTSPLASLTPAVDEAYRHWCYSCEKQVYIETLADPSDIICGECRGGFVESIAAMVPPFQTPSGAGTGGGALALMTGGVSQDRYATSLLPHGFIGFDPDLWNDEDDDDFIEEDGTHDGPYPSDSERDLSVHRGRNLEIQQRLRELIGTQIREMAGRSDNGHVDWEELSGIFDGEAMQRRFRDIFNRYAGDRDNYAIEARYEALLQNLADIDGGGRRGAPPASKGAVDSLEIQEIGSDKEDLVCAICKDPMNVGDAAKKLPCGHVYHGGCIVPWLGSRNSCPVCRFELPTDDLTYEEEKKKKQRIEASEDGGASGSGTSSSSME